VIDEAHAYDAYTGRLVENLIRFQAGIGGSIVILSATLHAEYRRRLVVAFREGLRAPTELVSDEGRAPYPLMTVIGRESVDRHTIEPVAALARTVLVERLVDIAAAEARVIAAYRQGAAVAYVRNSVHDAIETAERLRVAGLDPILFHARFAMGDRQNIETDVVTRFGRDADPATRVERPLVATQVVEQSLDLDFDLMITDLAPIDLLLQRAGRVWRHMDERPKNIRRIAQPTICVVSKDPTGEIAGDWVRALLPRTAAIYPDAALLWRSARILFAAGRFVAPGDLRDFVDRAYATKLDPDLATPQALITSERRREGERGGERTHAGQVALKYDDGYRRGMTWVDDAKIQTRLGEPRITLRLARIEEGKVVPWFAADDIEIAWALSEVEVATRLVTGVAPAHWDPAIAQARATFGRFEQDVPVLVLEPAAQSTWSGSALSGAGAPVNVIYSMASGLRIGT
jgi:CRISPR-associated endonuclease/helicase Cas3